jgi:hypothetical protein
MSGIESEIMSEEILKEKLKSNFVELKERLDICLDNVDLTENISSYLKISESMKIVENEISKMEGEIELDDIADESSIVRQRVIDEKVIKLFAPYMMYYRVCLLNS